MNNNIAYVQVAAGGIDAIDLNSGKRVWHTSLATKPLASAGRKLIAESTGPQRNEIRVVILNTAAGESRLKSIQVSFPEAVNTLDSAFQYKASLAKDDLVLDWLYRPPFRGGTSKRREGPPSPVSDFSGVTYVDLKTGDVQTQERPSVLGIVQLEAPPDTSLLPYRRFSVWTTDSWRAGRYTSRLITEHVPGGQMVMMLRSVERNKPERIALLSGADPFAFVTADGCNVLVTRNKPEETQPWEIFSVDTGKRTGLVQFERGSESPSVFGFRAYWLVNRSIDSHRIEMLVRSADTKTGDTLWEYSLGVVANDTSNKRPQ